MSGPHERDPADHRGLQCQCAHVLGFEVVHVCLPAGAREHLGLQGHGLEQVRDDEPDRERKQRQQLRLRVAPDIQFKEDDTIARAARIESLLADVKKNDAAAPESGRKED